MNWQCCLVGSSKTAPKIFISSIILGAKYLSYVKSIATFVLTFFGYIILVLASVTIELLCNSSYNKKMNSHYKKEFPTFSNWAWNREKVNWFCTLRLFFSPLLAIKRKTKSVVILQLVDMKPIFRNICFSFLNFAVYIVNSKTNENFLKGQCHVVLALRDNDCVAVHIKQERLIFVLKIVLFFVRARKTEGSWVYSCYIWQISQGQMANFPAFIASKSFDLWKHHISQGGGM